MPTESEAEIRLSAPTRGLLWVLIGLDVAVAVWMVQTGPWLDSTRIGRLLTLGGHHQWVLGLGVLGFLLLAALALLTRGFLRLRGAQRVLVPAAGVVSAVALAGPAVVAGLVLGGCLLGRLLFGRRPDTFLRRR